MPAIAPKKKAAPAKKASAIKKSAAQPAEKSNIIPNYFKGKIIVHPDFFEEHERPANWPSGQ